MKIKEKDLLFLAVSSCILTLAWIGFNVYNSLTNTTISNDLSLQISQISPDFDQKTIEALRTRKRILPSFEVTQASDSANVTDLSKIPTPPQSKTLPDNSQPTPLIPQVTLSPQPSTQQSPVPSSLTPIPSGSGPTP